ncbi:4Fe-4S binding protein [Vallitalea okinawensis]|uniref:4Fe-4S binding protein n=1 Tax=Vallitalea okinawensis TaxID=2078660 RepID=UPI000CFC25B8|nr:reductive dehalogenase domain-containing protein [Vallitalea okinawensis]
MNPTKIIKRHIPIGDPKKLPQQEGLLSASEDAREGLIVPELIMKYGDQSKGNGLSQKRSVLPTMMKTLYQMKRSYSSLKNNPKDSKVDATPEFIQELKDYGRSLGVTAMGFTDVESKDIFKGRSVLFNKAIVITMEMREEPIRNAPSEATQKEIFRTYHGLGVIVNHIANFLRNHGYQAQAGPALGGDAIYPVLGEKAGLGAIGKHGLLISPECGPRQRIAAIYTNIENLPISKENSHGWIKDFCDKCGKCVRKCPGEAIYTTPIEHTDGGKICVDYKKCAVPFSNSYGCTVCIRECAFNTRTYEELKHQVEFKKTKESL